MEIFLVALRRTETVLGQTSVGCTATSLVRMKVQGLLYCAEGPGEEISRARGAWFIG